MDLCGFKKLRSFSHLGSSQRFHPGKRSSSSGARTLSTTGGCRETPGKSPVAARDQMCEQIYLYSATYTMGNCFFFLRWRAGRGAFPSNWERECCRPQVDVGKHQVKVQRLQGRFEISNVLIFRRILHERMDPGLTSGRIVTEFCVVWCLTVHLRLPEKPSDVNRSISTVLPTQWEIVFEVESWEGGISFKLGAGMLSATGGCRMPHQRDAATR